MDWDQWVKDVQADADHDGGDGPKEMMAPAVVVGTTTKTPTKIPKKPVKDDDDTPPKKPTKDDDDDDKPHKVDVTQSGHDHVYGDVNVSKDNTDVDIELLQ